MFENSVISYLIDDDICIITYKRNSFIDADAGRSIVAEKKRLLKQYPIRKFVGVIHSSVKIDRKIMGQFTTKEAIGGVDAIAVVYISEKRAVNKYYKIGSKLLNLLVLGLLKTPKIRFFTSEKSAIKWIKNITL